MQAGSYFVSEQEEMAAKWQMVEDYKKITARLVTLQEEMKRVAQEWIELGRVLQSPNGILFDIQKQQITATNKLSNAKVADVRSSRVNWESLTKLVSDYQESLKRKDELGSRLKELGANFEPYISGHSG
jgi:septation ring formation regulator EzrA